MNDERSGDSAVLSIVFVLTQVVTVARLIQPVVQWIVQTVRESRFHKVCRKVKQRHDSNCKLRALAYSVTDGVIDILQEQPGGYSFFGLLPKKGRSNKGAVRRKIANYLLSTFFNDTFLTICLTAALTPEGRPNKQLYDWLLCNVYSGDVQELYSDWLKCKKSEVE